MGTLAAKYKTSDLNLKNLMKYKYLLYIFLVLTVFFCPGKKKKGRGEKGEKKKQNKRKTKMDEMYKLFYLLLPCYFPLKCFLSINIWKKIIINQQVSRI